MNATSQAMPGEEAIDKLLHTNAHLIEGARKAFDTGTQVNDMWFHSLVAHLSAIARALSPSDGFSDVPCRFGCEGAVGIYLVPKGCVCWDDPVQALCQQHALKAQSEGPITLIARPFGVRPSDGGEWNEALGECEKICGEWLALFASRNPVYVSASKWASDAVRDIGDAIAKLKRPPVPQEDE